MEFDTVVILGADKMDVNNLYVAMTRACKKLILVSESDVLMPWQNGTSLLRYKKITKETKKLKALKWILISELEKYRYLLDERI